MVANIQKIKAYIVSGQATSAPPLGPLLGQYQINISDFVPKFNEQSLTKFEPGVVLSVVILRNPKDKSYKIILKGPTLIGLINSVSKITKKRPKRECVSLEKLYDIVRIKHKLLNEFNNQNLPIDSVARSVFSTLLGSRIYIL